MLWIVFFDDAIGISYTRSLLPDENDEEARGLFAALIKLTETNTRNNQLEAQTYAHIYQLTDRERFDELYYAFSNTLTSMFHRPPIGYDTFVQKVQA